MQNPNDIAFKAESIREYLTQAGKYLAEANALLVDDRSQELLFLRFDLRDLLLGTQLASQRAAKLAPPAELALDDTQPLKPVQP